MRLKEGLHIRMKRFKLFFTGIFVSSICILICCSVIFAEGNFESMQCDVIKTDSQEGFSMAFKLYIKGNKSRVESPNMIMIYNGSTQYIYYPQQNYAVALSYSPRETLQLINQAFGTQMPSENEVARKLVGEETVDGKLCDVYEYSYQERIVKVWTAKNLNMPIKIEEGVFGTYYKNIVVNKPIDDSLFELPSGVTANAPLEKGVNPWAGQKN